MSEAAYVRESELRMELDLKLASLVRHEGCFTCVHYDPLASGDFDDGFDSAEEYDRYRVFCSHYGKKVDVRINCREWGG